MSDHIPYEIQLEVMNKLPVKSLVRFRGVSREWKSTIGSLGFTREYGVWESDDCFFSLTYTLGFQNLVRLVDKNFTMTPVLTNLQLYSMTPVGTSEGISCFSYGSNMMAVIWNPSVRKTKGVIVPYNITQKESEKVVFGFGVCPDTLDPTIVKVSYPYAGKGPWFVHVYKASTGNWVEAPPNGLPRQSIRIRKKSGQVVIGRFIYWAGTDKFVSNDGVLVRNSLLLSFDLSNHHFHVIDFPDQLIFDLPCKFNIVELRNSIVLGGTFFRGLMHHACAWILTVVDGHVSTFSVLFMIPAHNFVKLIGFTKDEDPIVEVDDTGYLMLHTLKVYDLTAGEYRNLGIEGDAGSFYIGSFKESLILLQ